MERSHAQAVMDDLHDALGRRLAVSSLAPCPVEFTAALVNLCSTQSCGKCTPCRVGLSALSDLLADVLEGRADESTLNLIERTARTIYLSSDCAIGYEAGAMALTAICGFRDDFEHHIREHSCGFDREARVPCVSGCPAHVDIPGYISLVEAGRYADAVKVIRKNNPLPLVCGLVCEHPCEMHCRRGMVDDPMNILALKRFAVEHSDLNDHKPHVVDNTGKRVAVIGGGPAGLSCAYYLAVMGHKVTIFEQRHHLGGMLRYGIPSYRLPRERLQAEIDWILSAGIDVELDHSVNGEELARLREEKAELETLLGSDTLMRKLVIKEIRADAAKYGDARRTLIETASMTTRSEVAVVADEPVTLIVSAKGWARVRQGQGLDLSSVAYKDGDGPGWAIECRSVDPLVILSSEGRAFTVAIAELPDGRGMGAPLPSFVDMGNSRIVHLLVGHPEEEWLIAKSAGTGFICTFGDLISRQKAGKAFVTIEEGATLLPPCRIAPECDHLAALSQDGRLLVFPLEQMKRLSGGKGVQIIGLKAQETLKEVLAVTGAAVRIRGIFRKQPKELLSDEKHLGQRARRGAAVGLVNQPTLLPL